jgi:hypothetical protein
MNEAIPMRPSDFVSNLDEVEISESEDGKSKRVVVPMTGNRETVHHDLSRDVKYRSIVTCT